MWIMIIIAVFCMMNVTQNHTSIIQCMEQNLCIGACFVVFGAWVSRSMFVLSMDWPTYTLNRAANLV